MTTTEETTTEQCPEWCHLCTPPQLGETHFGDAHTIRLSFMPPESGHDEMHGAKWWVPSEIGVSLEQNYGAYFPMVRIGKAEGSEAETLKLSLGEVMDLIGLLMEVHEQGSRHARSTSAARPAPGPLEDLDDIRRSVSQMLAQLDRITGRLASAVAPAS